MSKNLIFYGLVLLFAIVLQAECGGHGGGHGGSILIKTGGGSRHRSDSDIIMIGNQGKCGGTPTIIKTGGGRHRHRSGDMILLGGQNDCHKKKTEYVPIPYPIKEQVHVPVHIPVKETVHVPVHIPMMKHEDHGWAHGGMGHIDMAGGYGMDMGHGWKR